jgi:glutamyl/glutaminyl-tRNA synthetase
VQIVGRIAKQKGIGKREKQREEDWKPFRQARKKEEGSAVWRLTLDDLEADSEDESNFKFDYDKRGRRG